MKRILFIHGKNAKPPPALHRQQLLRCLLHGVERIDPGCAADIAAADSFSLVAWSQLFHPTPRDITQLIPWIDKLLEQEPPREGNLRHAPPLRYGFIRTLYKLGDAMPWLIPLIPDRRVKQSIRETELYFSNHDNLGCAARELPKQVLRQTAEAADRVLLIGHSMGSVIAYDALWELHHLEGVSACVDCFLTIGSPLGMNYVQQRLTGMAHAHPYRYPGNIRSWINVAARGDLVALDPSLADDFADMVTHHYIESIDDHRKGIVNYYLDANGLNVHKSYGYLVNPVVAKVIADWWRRP